MIEERTVWVVREIRKFDISNAVEFGQLSVIYPPTVSPLDMAAQLSIIESTVMPAARSGDLILMAGPSIMLSALVTAFARQFQRVNVLAFDSRSKRYIERWI